MTSEKPGVQDLIALFKAKNIQDIIISPGSRNAALNIAFHQDAYFNCKAVMDERVAAFIALGMSQASQKPTALVCTSGSAILNYYPAVAEAFYQKVPLVIISADRPLDWIDQADGQTIRQEKVLDQHLNKSVQLKQEVKSEQDRWYNQRLINEALNASLFPNKGPVHINFPFEEPLYEKANTNSAVVKNITPTPLHAQLSTSTLDEFVHTWNNSSSRLVLAGMQESNPQLNEILDQLAEMGQVVVMTETTSNLYSPHFFPCIDRIINHLSEEEAETLKPDLLITIGNAIVSKKIKRLLREHKAVNHWHISPNSYHPDTYQQLTSSIQLHPEDFFKQLTSSPLAPSSPEYFQQWKNIDIAHEEAHYQFISTLEWCDLKAFSIFQKNIPEESEVQLSNSSPVRYAQLFNWDYSLTFHANRGTSGIDGCTSTALGYALKSNTLTTVITGDVSFFYDSNAFYHNHVPSNLRVVLINNGGGGIFRIIPGPGSTEELEDFFETHHNFKANGIASAFGLDYISATDEESLEVALEDFYAPNREKAVILELFTPRMKNATILKDYFQSLKN